MNHKSIQSIPSRTGYPNDLMPSSLVLARTGASIAPRDDWILLRQFFFSSSICTTLLQQNHILLYLDFSLLEIYFRAWQKKNKRREEKMKILSNISMLVYRQLSNAIDITVDRTKIKNQQKKEKLFVFVAVFRLLLLLPWRETLHHITTVNRRKVPIFYYRNLSACYDHVIMTDPNPESNANANHDVANQVTGQTNSNGASTSTQRATCNNEYKF